MLKTVKPETLNHWLANNEAYLIDVRETQEYKAESIKQSHLIPLSQFNAIKVLGDLKNVNKKIVIHCRSGMRSRTACERLLAENPDLEVYNLEGGILSWNNAGFPVAGNAAGSKCSMSLERQTQFAVGILVLFSTIFGLRILTAIIGIGLIFAGLSGWCGMQKFLSKMPWNN